MYRQPPESTRSRLRRIILPILIGIGLFAALLALAGCRAGSRATEDIFAPYRPAVKAANQSEFIGLEGAPRYAIEVTLDPVNELLTGTATIAVRNTSPDLWGDIVFRLYPAIQHYGGTVTVFSALVENRPTNFVYENANTAVRVRLPDPLPTNRSVTVRLAWKIEIPSWADTPGIYALFGRSQQMISLPLFYPSLAVYLPGPAINSGSWWSEIGSARGDAAMNVTSLFHVTATLPSELVPVSSGTLVSTDELEESRTRYTWVTGPSREFLLHAGAQFRSASLDAYGTRITSYWLPGQEAAGRAALAYAVAALRIYSDYFGPYPFRDMRVAPAPLSYRGMEYPQVNLLGVELYTRFRDNLEILVAHEVAHQWWYQIVHNDPVNTPWLDEALAEYSVKLYYEALQGRGTANLLQSRRWQTPLSLLSEPSESIAVDRRVDSFDSGTQYETIIYGKGALFYDQMRGEIGDRRFKRFLQEYLERHRYRIVTTEDWLALLREEQNPILERLFAEWIEREEQLAPVPTVEPEAATEATGDVVR